MAEQRTVTVRYWTWCRWRWIRYPCRKTRDEVRWCYDFSIGRHRCFGVAQQWEACEDGVEYHFRTWCFGFWRNWQLIDTPFTRCFRKQLNADGPCSLSSEHPDVD